MRIWTLLLSTLLVLTLVGVSQAGHRYHNDVDFGFIISVPGVVLSVTDDVFYHPRYHHRDRRVYREYREYREYSPRPYRHHRQRIERRPYRPHIPECYKPGYRCYEEYRYRLERR